MTFGAILMGSAVSNIRKLDNPIENAATETLGFLKQIRARAMSSTLAYKVSPESTTRLRVQYSTTCTGTMVSDNSLFLELPKTTSFAATNWNTCFSPRGLASANVTFAIQDVGDHLKTIEVVLGGAARIQE